MKALGDLSLGQYETAESFLSRLAAHYGCANVPELCRDFEIPFREAITGVDRALAQLAELTGADLKTIRTNTPKSKHGTITFGSEELASSYSRRGDAFGCPECMAADIAAHPHLIPQAAVHFRRHWAISPILTCAMHRRPLVLVGERTGPYNKYDMALMADGLVERLPDLLHDKRRRDASGFELYVVSRLDGERLSGTPFDSMDLNEVFSLCGAMGRVVNDGTHLAKQSDDERYATFEAGFALLSGGRAALRDFFFWHISERLGRTPLGAAPLLGEVYGLILGHRRRKFAAIVPDIANAVYDVMPYAPGDHPIADVPVTHRRCYYPSGAAKEFGFAPKTIAHYAIAKGIARVLVPPTSSSSKIGTVWIDAAKAKDLFGQPLDFGWKKGLKQLGFTNNGVEAVVQDELLKPIFPHGTAGKHGVSPVRVNATRELVDLMAKHAIPVEKMPKGCKLLRQSAYTVEGLRRVHKAVLEGSIWVGQLTVARRPYSSLIIQDREIKGLLASKDYVTIDELARRSGLNKDMIYEMMRSGILECHTVLDIKSGISIRVFSHAVATNAEKEYVMLRQLAGGSPRRAGTLKGKLHAAGVAPVLSVTNTSGNEISVYRRSEVSTV